MDDVLHTHAERVAAANAELVERMGRIRGDADAQMREKLSLGALNRGGAR